MKGTKGSTSKTSSGSDVDEYKTAYKIRDYFRDSVILFVDHGLFDDASVAAVFRRHRLASHLSFSRSGDDGLDTVKRGNVGAIFVSQDLPDMSGLDFLRKLKKPRIEMPLVFVTESRTKNIAARALRAGAHDCLVHGDVHLESLPLILDRAITRFKLDRERADMERLVVESRKQWLAIFDAITDFIFILDSDGKIVKANRSLANALGMHPKFIAGRTCYDLLGIEPGSGAVQAADLRAKTEEKTINGKTYLISSFPMNYGNRQMTVYVMKNITEMRQLKDQLYHSDKLASLGLLVSGVAHEINNPLTGVIAYTELLRMKITGEEAEKDLRKILESAERCKKIVVNLLTFSRQQTPSRSLESINDIIERAIDLRSYWLRANNVEVVRDFDQIQSVFVDGQQIQQVILNILLNAEQAITGTQGEQGKITFVTRHVRDGRKVIIRITDNGPGIPPSIVDKIFDPFFTTKPVGAGTGLGLSISHGIIQEHGGTIVVESMEGQGTTFVIELPLPSGDDGVSVSPDYRDVISKMKAESPPRKSGKAARG